MKKERTEEALDPQMSKALTQSLESRAELTKEIQAAIKDVYKKGLQLIEQSLPDCHEEGSSDNRVYKIVRNELLNYGNAKSREIPEILRCYITQKIYHREVMRKIQINQPFKLPDQKKDS